MRYTSTRADLDQDFSTVVASGLAPDGGLYLPQEIPQITPEDLAHLADADYATCLSFVGRLFDGGALDAQAWDRLARHALKGFRHPAIAPLNQLAPRHWLLELFHGPTLSFKDYGLQPLSSLLSELAAHDGRPLFILGATSGDTGSAALAAFRGKANARIVILHPHGRVSDVQRRQMTTLNDDNILNIAVEGSFDDCQRIVKALLDQRSAQKREAVLSVNSINWGRLLFQTAYYVHMGARLGRPFALSVPSGNFGNALSAVLAAKMGVPIHHLIVATNANRALSRIFETGETVKGTVQSTLSPAMDIQIPSNLERLLYILNNCDAKITCNQMEEFARDGRLALPGDWRKSLPLSLESFSVTDKEVLECIKDTYANTDRVIDPHTAVAVAAANRAKGAGDLTILSVSTAHPAKFPEAVESALGISPLVPALLRDLHKLEERFTITEPTIEAVAAAIG